MRLIIACSAIFIFLIPSSLYAGQGTITGKEAEGWDTGYFNVVIGVLKDAKQDGARDLGRYAAMFDPIATIGGHFDPSSHPTLPVRFYIGKPTSSIEEIPPNGKIVIAVLLVGVLQGDEKEPSNWIASDICTFMPGKSALTMIKGMDDIKILETLKKLQNVRVPSNSAPTAKTKPSLNDR